MALGDSEPFGERRRAVEQPNSTATLSMFSAGPREPDPVSRVARAERDLLREDLEKPVALSLCLSVRLLMPSELLAPMAENSLDVTGIRIETQEYPCVQAA